MYSYCVNVIYKTGFTAWCTARSKDPQSLTSLQVQYPDYAIGHLGKTNTCIQNSYCVNVICMTGSTAQCTNCSKDPQSLASLQLEQPDYAKGNLGKTNTCIQITYIQSYRIIKNPNGKQHGPNKDMYSEPLVYTELQNNSVCFYVWIK